MTENFDNGYVVIDFYADWCSPCKLMSPIIDNLSRVFKNKIKFVKINTEDNESITTKYNIMSLPTFILLNNGKEIERFSGSKSENDFKEVLVKYL